MSKKEQSPGTWYLTQGKNPCRKDPRVKASVERCKNCVYFMGINDWFNMTGKEPVISCDNLNPLPDPLYLDLKDAKELADEGV